MFMVNCRSKRFQDKVIFKGRCHFTRIRAISKEGPSLSRRLWAPRVMGCEAAAGEAERVPRRGVGGRAAGAEPRPQHLPAPPPPAETVRELWRAVALTKDVVGFV